jgi:hypothetical protein
MTPDREIINNLLIDYYGEKVDTTLVTARIIEELANKNYHIYYEHTKTMQFKDVKEFFKQRCESTGFTDALYFTVEGVWENFSCRWNDPDQPHLDILGFPGSVLVDSIDPDSNVTVNI